MTKRVVVLGLGRVGGALARLLGREAGLDLVLVDREPGRAEALAGDLSAESVVADAHVAAALEPLVDGASVVVDATEFGGRDRSTVEAVLARGAHWVDLSGTREWVLGTRELDETARERGLRVASGAGVFCGLTEPFARAGTEPMVRVNEVLFGVLPGPRGRFGPASSRSWLGAGRATVRMLIGGEWTDREFFGDARNFEHPAPFGAQRSFNVDAVDLELLTERPVRAASVRLSFSFGGGLRNRVAEGRLRGGRPGGWDRLASWARLGGNPPGAVLTILMRGVDANRMPLENRVALVDEGVEPRLELAAARRLVLSLLAGGVEPGAGPCAGLLEASDLERDLEAAGVRVRRGNLGGWEA